VGPCVGERAAQQADEADEALGGTRLAIDVRPDGGAASCPRWQNGRGHRFAAYPRCWADPGGEWRVTGKWKDYDPGWLVELAQTVASEEPGLSEAFKGCTRCMSNTRAYIYFVDPRAPNEPGSEWHFDRNVVLESPTVGTIVVDVLADGRVGGLEFLSRL
jgi:hypothetical protein